jgi:ABC-type transporter Mla maintaining outer membrane lipid asymmetry ATPase subunit MlaF
MSAPDHVHDGIVLRGLTARGDDGFQLGPVELDVRPGTLTSVVGPASAGKSLLLFALAGMVPAAGEAWVAGCRLGATPLDALRPRIGFSFQRDALALELTAAENVALAARRAPDGAVHDADTTEVRTREALAVVGLDAAGHKRPGELSGGMRRRVGLARALATGAPVLLLDDATAGLDPSTSAEVLERVLHAAVRRPAAVLLVTADVDTALPRSSQVLLLDDGVVRCAGAVDVLPTEGPLAAFRPRVAALAEVQP